METVQANILGRDYSLACPPEEKATLEAAVKHVSALAGGIQGSGKVAGNEKIAVMAAIQIAAELLVLRSPDGPLGSLSVGDFKRKIEDMNAMLDSVS
ncbi:MAG: cell division protein ZapA [Orrella sp.]